MPTGVRPPTFTSVEEADRWFAEQARLAREECWLHAHALELWGGGCVRWTPDDHTVISYTKTKVGAPARYVLVVRRSSWVTVGNHKKLEGKVIYMRAFAKRSDAKEKALAFYAKYNKEWARKNGR